MSEADVLTALQELDFGELIPGLQESMEGAPAAAAQAP